MIPVSFRPERAQHRTSPAATDRAEFKARLAENRALRTVQDASENRVLVLQGGGALGSYQAGVYEALDAEGFRPGWIAGISIGAINAALIAGNPPDTRLKQLRAFWEQVSSTVLGDPVLPGDAAHSWFNEVSAAWVASFGVTGFFSPRFPPAFLYPPGWPQALSFYDTSSLRSTLESLIDFDRINARETRLSVGAVNLRTGNFIYFDNARERIRPDHIMASAALPPGFPPIEIDGECYWDGGLVSNTPLDYVLDKAPRQDLLIFQVDLFPARGPMPRTLIEVNERAKDIRYSSRTRLNTDANIATHQARAALHRILHQLPEELRSDPDIALLEDFSRENAVTVMQLIYRRRNYERASKDYEFSRSTMREHWASGRRDVGHSLLHRDWRNWLARRRPEGGVAVFDLTRDASD